MQRPGAEDPGGPNGLSAVERLAALQRLLDGGQAQEVERLRETVDEWEVTPEVLGPALPEALAEEVESGRLGRTLQPAIEDAIEASVKRDPQRLADAIFPVIGPAIRKAVTAALRGATESLNQVLEHSFTVRGLSWRLEAARTGRPFAEVVLLNSLVYRVEQVFLIHRETALCVARAAAPGYGLLDPDTVASMLVALQDYVRQSFAKDQDSGELTNLEVGEHTVWVERGPHAAVAAVIVGSPPAELRDVLQTTVETVHSAAGERLRTWTGDPDPVLDGLGTYLEDCLQSRQERGSSEGSASGSKGKVALVLIGFAMVLAPVLWFFHRAGVRQQWDRALEALAAEPGLVVVKSEPEDGVLEIVGLRDPLARDPADVLSGLELDPERVTMAWHAFDSPDPAIVAERARAKLAPPDGVRLEVDGTKLLIHAPAASPELDELRKKALLVPGVLAVDLVLPSAGDKEDS